MNIGFIGLGAMGLPMTRHLVDAGHDVTVASRSRGPVDAAVAFGAVAADGATRRRRGERGDDPLRTELARGRRGRRCRAPRARAGKVVVDTSTIDPDVERAQHERVSATGARYLEAPLSGGTAGAQKGTLDADGGRRRRHPRRRTTRARTLRRG